MFKKIWKQQWNLQALKLEYDHPEEFVHCHWQKGKKILTIWIVYRTVMAAYFLASFLFTLPFNKATQESWSKYWCFLTNWTYTIETSYYQLAFIIVALETYAERKKLHKHPRKTMPWYYKFLWVLYTIVLAGAFVVTSIFWSALYTPEEDSLDATNVMTHALNSVFILLEISLVAQPTRLLHFYLPISYGLCYAVFSVFYQGFWPTGLKNSEPLYEILDWKKPGQAFLTCIGSLFCLLVLHIIFVLVHILKIYIKARLNKKRRVRHR